MDRVRNYAFCKSGKVMRGEFTCFYVQPGTGKIIVEHVCKRYNFELFTQGFLSSRLLWLLRSVIWVSVFAPGLWSAIWVSFFHSRSVVRVTFQSLGMSVFWVKNESVWSVMTTCNGISGTGGGVESLTMPPARDPPFKALFQLQRPHFYFSKIFAFSSPVFADFDLISAPEIQILAKICSGDASYQFQVKRSVQIGPESTFENLSSMPHTYPKFFWVQPPSQARQDHKILKFYISYWNLFYW